VLKLGNCFYECNAFGVEFCHDFKEVSLATPVADGVQDGVGMAVGKCSNLVCIATGIDVSPTTPDVFGDFHCELFSQKYTGKPNEQIYFPQ
jgi:hypothetical protein